MATLKIAEIGYLFFTATEHTDDAEADRLNGEGGRPVLGQDGQADVAVTVDVRVYGNVETDEHHLKKCFLFF